MQSDQWRMVTEGIVGKYCGSTNPSLVMGNQVNDKFAVTHDVNLKPGDIIQFWVIIMLYYYVYKVILLYSCIYLYL